ncbi:E-selectin-like [Branchiostoma lanceolatum]|uniref:E-selectin-like n=1 Tax=Branchiostoma lanceolatum TaxID=7740 RepID=UPI003455F449
MKFLHRIFVLLLISALILESEGWRRRRSRRAPPRCSTPPTPANSYIFGCSYPYTHGERCCFACRSGYTRVYGSTVRTCSNGHWTGSNLVCRPVGCSSPPTPANSYRYGCSSPYTNGERCCFGCRSGYTQVYGSTVRTCSSGRWTGSNLVCVPVGGGCSSPPTPANSYRYGCSAPYTNGETCCFACRSGYTQVYGSTVRTCHNGHWTGSNLVCRLVGGGGCPAPPTSYSTYMYGCSSPYTQGERCCFGCRSGYTRVSGSTVRTCSNGAWTGTRLSCDRPSWLLGKQCLQAGFNTFNASPHLQCISMVHITPQKM